MKKEHDFTLYFLAGAISLVFVAILMMLSPSIVGLVL